MIEPFSPLPTDTGFDVRDNAGQEAARAGPTVQPSPLPEPPPAPAQVTFIFTDIEDSTGHWQRLHDGMRRAQEAHDTLMRQAFTEQGGRVFRTIGDAFCVAFGDAGQAVRAALTAQIGLQSVFLDEAGEVPLRARIALHTGIAEALDDDFYGLAPARAARVLEGIRGGQVLMTADTATLVQSDLPPDAHLSDLGPCRLRSFEDVEHLYQLHHPDLPLIVTPPRSAVSVPNNLPRQVTPFFGREAEISEARRRLSVYHLLTLVGMGGCGKTRLALRLTDFVYSDFTDGIYFVDLSGQRDDAQVAQAVALTLGVKVDGALPVTEQVTVHLRDKGLLLILDNCEQVIEGACQLADAILQAAPQVRMIATSREALGVMGESLLPVNPFPTPDPPRYPELLKWEAVRLWAERAASQSPRFQITRENAFAVAAVCRRVEGIPLGIVLTAAWASDYAPAQISRQLEERFNLLMTGRIRSLPARHRTLYATVDWGYGLLTLPEQTLLRRVALFRGGFTPDAAQAICGEGIPSVSSALDTLTRKSLLIADTTQTPGAIRYRTLDPVREYGEERLRENGEWAVLETAHRAYFVGWAEAIAPRTIAPDARQALEEIDAEQENLQAALHSADIDKDDDAGVRLIASLYWYWHVRGQVRQGQAWVARFLSSDAAALDPVTRIKAFNGAGVLAYDANDFETSLSFYKRALATAREAGDREREAACLSNVGYILALLKRDDEAEMHLQDSLSMYTLVNNRFRIATVYNNIGIQAHEVEDYAKAAQYYQKALDIQREYPFTPSLGVTLFNIAKVEMKYKQWIKALALFGECFMVRRHLKINFGMVRVLAYIPEVLMELGRVNEAAMVIGYLKAPAAQIDFESNPEVNEMLDTAREKICAAIGEVRLDREERRGRLLNLDTVAKVAFAEEVL